MKIFDIRQYAGDCAEPSRKLGDVQAVGKIKRELMDRVDNSIDISELAAGRLADWAPQDIYDDLLEDIPVFLADSTQMGARGVDPNRGARLP